MQNRLTHYLGAWALADPQALATTPTSHVYTVDYRGERVILKLLTPIGEVDEANGAHALRYFAGYGAVRVLLHDAHALLLEYAEGEDLKALVQRGDDHAATHIIGTLINQLHARRTHQAPTLIPLNRWFRQLFIQAERQPTAIYARGAHIAQTLLDNPQAQCVLHGDIHHENVRYRHQEGRGWLAIDPKGLYGERTYDAANTLYNPAGMEHISTDERRLLRTAHTLAGIMTIDPSRLLQYAFAYGCLSASWTLQGGGDPSHTLTIARLIEPHLK